MKRFILCSLSAAMALAAGATAQAQTDISSAATHSDEGVMSRFELRQNTLTRGVLSPDDLGPNNRAVNMTGIDDFSPYSSNSYSSSDRTNQRQDSNLPGVVAPNSQSPNNRATPGQGTSPNQRQQPMMDNMGTQNQDSNLPGVVAPNSQSPNNRATPGQ